MLWQGVIYREDLASLNPSLRGNLFLYSMQIATEQTLFKAIHRGKLL